MKKASRKSAINMKAEYVFASMKGGVRGNYAARYRRGTNLVLLDPELAKAFPSDAAVKAALRAALGRANGSHRASRSRAHKGGKSRRFLTGSS